MIELELDVDTLLPLGWLYEFANQVSLKYCIPKGGKWEILSWSLRNWAVLDNFQLRISDHGVGVIFLDAKAKALAFGTPAGWFVNSSYWLGKDSE